jgi:hypothetical protein
MEGPKKERKKRSLGAKNREMGHNGERKYARIFREAGWDKAQTARYASRLTDNCKNDVVFIPVNLQVKIGKHSALNIRKILKFMKEQVVISFPDHYPERTNPNVIVQDFPVGAGKRRQPEDSIVYMTFETFFDLLTRLHEKGKYVPQVTLLSDDNGVLSELPEAPKGEHSTEEDQ